MERFTPAPTHRTDGPQGSRPCEHCLDCSAEANITNTPPPHHPRPCATAVRFNSIALGVDRAFPHPHPVMAAQAAMAAWGWLMKWKNKRADAGRDFASRPPSIMKSRGPSARRTVSRKAEPDSSGLFRTHTCHAPAGPRASSWNEIDRRHQPEDHNHAPPPEIPAPAPLTPTLTCPPREYG